MTRDPRRLLDEGIERDLLDSAQDDGPSADAERRARIALGLTVPLIPMPGPEAASPAAAAAATAKAASGLLTMKIAAITVAVAGGAGTAGWLAMQAAEEPPAVESRIEEPPRIEAPRLEEPREEPIEAPALEETPVEPELAPAPAPRSKPERQRSAQATLQLELELLRAARAHLEANEAIGAESVLDRYHREIDRGALREEAAALAVETAFALDRADARARAEAFLAEFPLSPHASRARALLQQEGP